MAAAARDLMARTGHDSEHAAIIYQHVTRGADEVITAAMPGPLTVLTWTQCTTSDRDEHSGTRANGPPIARGPMALGTAPKLTRRSPTWHRRAEDWVETLRVRTMGLLSPLFRADGLLTPGG